jgi:cholera toxin transcriptional activator
MSATPENRLFRFALFEADAASGELRKQGRRLRLQGQPFEILLLLLERPGEVVTREEIRQRLWPEGTYVDFDHSLNTAVNKLREALGDSASNPRFIETLARRGYRFIAPVDAGQQPITHLEVQAPAATDAPADLPAPNYAAGITRVLTRPDEVPQTHRAVVRVLFALAQVMYLFFYLMVLAKMGEVQEIVAATVQHAFWAVLVLMVSGVAAIPIRLYLLSGVSFDAPGLRDKFLRLFPAIFLLDEIWALAPFLLVRQIGLGLALGATAALLYLPFAERSLMLMGAGAPAAAAASGKP